MSAGFPSAADAQRLRDEADLQRAIVAYRFWYPTVSVEGIFQGNRDLGNADGQRLGVVAALPRHVGFTLNSDTPYGSGTLDLTDGPIVIEVPPGPYVGLVDDHHQRWVLDMGIPGPDEGRGGTHVVVGPGWDGDLPDGAHVGHCRSYKALIAVRALPLDGDMAKAMDALRAIRVHRLGDDRPIEIADFTDHDTDMSCLRWEDSLAFWEVLHRVLDAEPVVDEFRPMHGLLAALGIRRGEPFAPDERLRAILERAAHEGREQLLTSAFASAREDRLAWADRRWEWAGLVPDDPDFETPAGLDLEARDRWFAQAIVASPAMFRRVEGGGSLYWLACRDAGGASLHGSQTSTLDVPLPVPGKLFWSLTIYDAQTRSQVQAPQGNAALRSLIELRDLPEEGSVALTVGPEAPAEGQDRWLQTVPDRGWFAYLRIYGPGAPAFDGTWRPGDFVGA